MRRRASLIALCIGLVFNSAAQAEPLAARWVSAGGALSEWVVALGGESRLVGVDTTSQHPASLKALPSIGYQRQLSAEGVLSLRPDLLVGTEEMGPPEVLKQLRGTGVKVELFSSTLELQAVHGNLRQLGRLMGDESQAERLFGEYRQQLDGLAARIKAVQGSQAAPGVILLVGHGGAKPMIAGKGTAGDWMIRQAGGRNLADNDGYKNFSVEALAALNPQVLVFADRSLSGEAARQALLKENPALAASRAARDKRLVELDPTLLVGGLGPRQPASLQALAQAFYPAAKAQLAP
ncbi:ABC transporter substrate-binding protein [Pseudomonas qingdaonensis]|uniref:heme/hemin ABC transporter substrate-binding protein n=1 Tax=Pseudomonas qingdaonensis TaxID=2056231 RepID=UPI00265D78CE|nr:ABC transporter substrate-binding protein [Pseudomonas qingdaonensis]WKL68477.1 ABC transporter substrate-binding protein [Pseudomonas qingdaonensis]